MIADRISTTGQIVLKSEEVSTNTASGNTTTRVYTGSRDLILAQRVIENYLGASTTKTESMGNGNYQLTAGYTWDVTQGSNAERPVNAHELENNMSQVEVWLSSNLRAKFVAAFGSQAAANSAIAYITSLVDSFNSSSDGTPASQATFENNIITRYSGTQQSIALNAFRGVAFHQVKNCIQFDTVYSRRITAASYNQVQAGFVGCGQIWTTDEVVNFENVPSMWWFQLPSSYLWLKSQPRVATVAGQKTEISYNYLAVYEAWGLIYSAYGSAQLLNF